MVLIIPVRCYGGRKINREIERYIIHTIDKNYEESDFTLEKQTVIEELKDSQVFYLPQIPRNGPFYVQIRIFKSLYYGIDVWLWDRNSLFMGYTLVNSIAIDISRSKQNFFSEQITPKDSPCNFMPIPQEIYIMDKTKRIVLFDCHYDLYNFKFSIKNGKITSFKKYIASYP